MPSPEASVAPRILVIDDDHDLREVVTLVLEDQGFGIRSAANGSEALSLIADWMPSVILLDMRMPIMDGWEFMREFRRRHRDAPAKIIVFTAAEDAGQRAQEIGTDRYLSKPFDLDDVVNAVRAAL